MEIEIHHVRIILSGEIQNRTCLSALSATLDNQRFMSFFRLPLQQNRFYLSLIHNNTVIFIIDYQLFATFLGDFFANPYTFRGDFSRQRYTFRGDFLKNQGIFRKNFAKCSLQIFHDFCRLHSTNSQSALR